MLKRLTHDSLARNSVLIMASTVGTSALGYLFWMLAARTLAQPAVGAATALISAATVVSMLSNLGIGHMFIQRLPGTDTAGWSRTVSGGLVLGCGATALASIVTVAAAPGLSANFAFLRSAGGALGLLAVAVTLTATTLLDYVFVAQRASHGMLGRNVALAAGKVVTLLALTDAGLHVSAAVLLAWTAPSAAVSVFTVRVMLPRLRPGARPALAGITAELRHVRGSLTGHHLINLAQAGPGALLPVLVTARLGTAENASFYVAWMTASVLFMVSPAVASAFYAERSNAGRDVSLPRAAVVVLAVIGPPALVLFFLGGRILGLFSSGYAIGGGMLLKILVLAAIPDAITNLAVAHWRSLGLFARCRRINLLMAAIGLSLTWLWLPRFGIAAAGLAWLAGQGAGAVLTAVLSLGGPRRPRRRHFTSRPRPPEKAGRPTRAPRVFRPAPGPRVHRPAARRRNEASAR